VDSLDAQCLLVDLFERESRAPDLWRHASDGGLSCAYAEGTRTFSWESRAVSDMAARWREEHGDEVPALARPFVDVHTRVRDLIDRGELGPPDAIIHDFPRSEVAAVWEEAKLVVVIEEVGVSPVIHSPRAAGEHPGSSKPRG
jgi:hypothetical protein